MLCWMMNQLNNRAQNIVVNGATSGWWQVTNGVPQGSVLLNIFNNDLDAVVEHILCKFADTILGDTVDTLEGQEAFQKDLDVL